jgi:hypothetical protein
MTTVLDFVMKRRAVAVMDVAKEFNISRQRALQLLQDEIMMGRIVRGVHRSYCVKGAENMIVGGRAAPSQEKITAFIKQKGTWVKREDIPGHQSTISKMVREGTLVKYGRFHVGLPDMGGDQEQLSVGARVLEYLKTHETVRACDARYIFKTKNPSCVLSRMAKQGELKVVSRGIYALA